MSLPKRIPEKVFVEWHSTGTKNHILLAGVVGDYSNCQICGVNTRKDDLYGCQGMRFEQWYKKRKKK